MAPTKKRRRKKHRGTQGGSLDRGRGGARPRSRAEARAQARAQVSRRKKGARTPATRMASPPTWRGAVNRALLGAGIFLVLLLLIFKQPAGSSIALSAFMVAVYIPMGHAMDRFFYNRRRASAQRARERNGRP